MLALAKILLHLPALNQYGIFVDEYYYIACSERLAWGYVDHPPLAVFVLSAIRALFGESIFALRIPVMLIGAGTVFLSGMMAREIGGGRFAQATAALAIIAAPIYPGVDKFFTTNSFEIFYWTLAIYLLLRILNRENAPGVMWFALGCVLGAGLLNKHSMLFLGFGVGVALLATGERRRLLGRGPYIAGAVAFAIFAPHILWQFANDWPTLEFMDNARRHKNYFALGEFVSAQILQQHPLLLPLWFGGLLYFAFARAALRFRMIAWIYISLFALFVAMQGKTYYLSPIYPVLYAGGAVWLERGLEFAAAKSRPNQTANTVLRSLQTGVLILIALGGAALAPLSLPLLSPENYLAYERFLGLKAPKLEKQALSKMPQHFASMFGFPDQSGAAIEVFQSLSPEEREHAVVLGRSYGFAGSVEYSARRQGLEIPVVSGHNNFYLWSLAKLRSFSEGPVFGKSGMIIVALGFDEERLQKYFADVRPAGTVRCEYCLSNATEITIYVCRGPRLSPVEILDDLRNFI